MNQLQVWAPNAHSVELVTQDRQSFSPPVILTPATITYRVHTISGYWQTPAAVVVPTHVSWTLMPADQPTRARELINVLRLMPNVRQAAALVAPASNAAITAASFSASTAVGRPPRRPRRRAAARPA